MKTNRSNKMKYVILVVLSILLVVVSTALYLQRRESRGLEEFDANNLEEKIQTEKTTGISSSGKSLSQNDEEIYKNKIKKLETQIVDMQEWQDYLKKTLKEHEDKTDSATMNQSKQISQADDFWLRKSFSSLYKDFFEENNIPPELREKFFDLLIEKNNAMKGVYRLLDLMSGKAKGDIEELMKKAEKITAEYNDKIAELLSEEGLAAFKEYEETGSERYFLREFKNMLGEDKLEKEKELKLISLMYNYRKNWEDERRKNVQAFEYNEKQPDKETLKKLNKVNVEWNKKLYEKYFSLAEGILSEAQMEKYEGFVNMRTAHLTMGNHDNE